MKYAYYVLRKFIAIFVWYSCSSAHSKPLNANQKAYGAWALWSAITQILEPGCTVFFIIVCAHVFIGGLVWKH